MFAPVAAGKVVPEMCGIFGYVGVERDTGSMVLDALRTLEYRGYDSWGVAIGLNGHIEVTKAVGKIGRMSLDLPPASIGFGHTRWATHGGVTVQNAHPHYSDDRQVAVIHNGIIENFRDLKNELITRGVRFTSDTDTEVIVHLVNEQLQPERTTSDVLRAVADVFKRLDGLNAIIIMDRLTETLTAAKNVSPLVFGRGTGGVYVASDQMALLPHATEIGFLEDGEILQLSREGIRLYDQDGLERGIVWQRPTMHQSAIGLDGFPHYLIKEIHEQPRVIRAIADDVVDDARLLADEIRKSYGTFFLGCGTASYAALSGSYLFSRIAKRHVNFVLGSEFSYQEHFLTDRSLVAALSQSGETADIIQSVMAAKLHGARIAALVNTAGSTLDRMADFSVHLQAGPELSVLSTKAYAAKVALLLLTAHILADREEEGRSLLHRAAEAIERTLDPHMIDRIRMVAQTVDEQSSLFAIGRGLNYPTALEAALKIKEVSYIHAEGFAGGELKHGVIALISDGTPCMAFVPNDETRADIVSGAMEIKSRGGYIIGVGPEPDPVFDVHIEVADVGDASPLAMVVPAQVLGYELALHRGLDPDKPRNLAKSVTVK